MPIRVNVELALETPPRRYYFQYLDLADEICFALRRPDELSLSMSKSWRPEDFGALELVSI